MTWRRRLQLGISLAWISTADDKWWHSQIRLDGLDGLDARTFRPILSRNPDFQFFSKQLYWKRMETLQILQHHWMSPIQVPNSQVSQEVKAAIRERNRLGFNIDINLRTLFDIGTRLTRLGHLRRLRKRNLMQWSKRCWQCSQSERSQGSNPPSLKNVVATHTHSGAGGQEGGVPRAIALHQLGSMDVWVEVILYNL